MSPGDCFALQQLSKNCDLQGKGKVEEVYFSTKAYTSNVLVFLFDSYSKFHFSTYYLEMFYFLSFFGLILPKDSGFVSEISAKT